MTSCVIIIFRWEGWFWVFSVWKIKRERKWLDGFRSDFCFGLYKTYSSFVSKKPFYSPLIFVIQILVHSRKIASLTSLTFLTWVNTRNLYSSHTFHIWLFEMHFLEALKKKALSRRIFWLFFCFFLFLTRGGEVTNCSC